MTSEGVQVMNDMKMKDHLIRLKTVPLCAHDSASSEVAPAKQKYLDQFLKQNKAFKANPNLSSIMFKRRRNLSQHWNVGYICYLENLMGSGTGTCKDCVVVLQG